MAAADAAQISSQAVQRVPPIQFVPEMIHLIVMMCVSFPLSLPNVEDLLFERGIDICHETVRFWWSRFRPMFVG